MVLLGVSAGAHAENLLDIYQQAQIKDTQLLESKAKRDQAFEKINESRAALLPQINLGAGLNYLQNKGDTQTNSNATGSLSLDQSIYRRSNWVNLSLTEKSATQSDVTYNLEIPEAERDQALADEINAENTLDNSYESLRELTGIDHRQLDVLNTERFSPQKTPFNSDKWLELALDKNLQLHSARIGKDIAKEQIDLAKTGHEPTLDLGAGLSSTYSDYKDEIRNPESNANQANIGLNFKLPLYSGGATTSQVKQSQFNYVAATPTAPSRRPKRVTKWVPVPSSTCWTPPASCTRPNRSSPRPATTTSSASSPSSRPPARWNRRIWKT